MMNSIDIPPSLEWYRNKLAATAKPYVEIQTHLTRKANLWQSKFTGFPYLPKNFDYPTTQKGDYLYLLAQINFAEVPRLEGFPERGILQFYISESELYGCDFENPTTQTGFRVLYFSNPDMNEDNLIANFDFLPSLWDRVDIPFYILPSYTPDRNDCFALTFNLKSAPITTCDYKFEELIGHEIWDVLRENKYSVWQEYHQKYEVGHRLGGYPYFTQSDPREGLSQEEPYLLLLQIDSDTKDAKTIDIQWGDIGVCNFFIKESALRQLDFSDVMYNWDCS